LTESDHEKVKVEEELELFIKHQGEEADYGIFLIPNDVGRIR
jgi:hypothetical protein